MGLTKPVAQAIGTGVEGFLKNFAPQLTDAGRNSIKLIRNRTDLNTLSKLNPEQSRQVIEHANKGQLVHMMKDVEDAGRGLLDQSRQEKVIKNTTTEIAAADKQVADEMIQSPEGQQFLTDQEATKQDYLSQYQMHVERAKLGYSRTDPEKFAHEGRFTKAKARVERAQRDNTSTAYANFIEDQLSDPMRAQKGYGMEKKARFPERDPKKGFKPSNKDLETGIKYEEYLEQHHLLFNAEGSAFGKQKIFKEDPAFLLATQRYVAKRYDSAFGEAAQNMANIPSDQVHKPYHLWLRKLKLDGVSGSNYEQFWKQKLKDNPNMTPQQIQDAVDEWFEEIIYPSVVMLDNWMKKADLSKVNQADIAFPDKLLKQARASIQNEMDKIKPTAKPGTTAADIQIDDIQTRAERGEFGSGRRQWFEDSKARKDAAATLQK